MSEDAATVRLRVHQFAKLEGVSVETVWLWIAAGKVTARKDRGGRRYWVYVENKHPEQAVTSSKVPE